MVLMIEVVVVMATMVKVVVVMAVVVGMVMVMAVVLIVLWSWFSWSFSRYLREMVYEVIVVRSGGEPRRHLLFGPPHLLGPN